MAGSDAPVEGLRFQRTGLRGPETGPASGRSVSVVGGMDATPDSERPGGGRGSAEFYPEAEGGQVLEPVRVLGDVDPSWELVDDLFSVRDVSEFASAVKGCAAAHIGADDGEAPVTLKPCGDTLIRVSSGRGSVQIRTATVPGMWAVDGPPGVAAAAGDLLGLLGDWKSGAPGPVPGRFVHDRGEIVNAAHPRRRIPSSRVSELPERGGEQTWLGAAKYLAYASLAHGLSTTEDLHRENIDAQEALSQGVQALLDRPIWVSRQTGTRIRSAVSAWGLPIVALSPSTGPKPAARQMISVHLAAPPRDGGDTPGRRLAEPAATLQAVFEPAGRDPETIVAVAEMLADAVHFASADDRFTGQKPCDFVMIASSESGHVAVASGSDTTADRFTVIAPPRLPADGHAGA